MNFINIVVENFESFSNFFGVVLPIANMALASLTHATILSWESTQQDWMDQAEYEMATGTAFEQVAATNPEELTDDQLDALIEATLKTLDLSEAEIEEYIVTSWIWVDLTAYPEYEDLGLGDDRVENQNCQHAVNEWGHCPHHCDIGYLPF